MEIAPAARRTATIAAIMTVVSFVLVALKLYIRYSVPRNLGLDDLFVALAFILSVPLTVTMYYQGIHGMGYHIYDISEKHAIAQTEWFWASILFYVIAIGFGKLSILMQYLRVFFARRTVIAVWLTVGFVSTYTIQGLFVAIFQCNPPQGFWDRKVKAYCINSFVYYTLAAVLNILTDLAVIVIPIPALHSLRVSRSKKIGLFMIFSLGGFGCVMAVVRLHTLIMLRPFITSGDTGFKNPLSALWSVLELHTCIICACLPALRPILSRILVMTGLSRSSSAGKTSSLPYPSFVHPPDQQRGSADLPRYENSQTMLFAGKPGDSTSGGTRRTSGETERRDGSNYNVSAEHIELDDYKGGGEVHPGQIVIHTRLEVPPRPYHTPSALESGSHVANRSSTLSDDINLIPEAHRGWYAAQVERDKRL